MHALKALVVVALISLMATGCADHGDANSTAPQVHENSAGLRRDGNLLVIITYGLGCSTDGPGYGLRAVAETIRTRYPTDEVITRAWDDHDGVEQTIENHNGPIVLIGHSFGGGKSVELASHARRPIDWLILLDPVPYDDWGVRHSGAYFRIPPNVLHAVCFYRPPGLWPLSYPIVNPANADDNHLLRIGHYDFCKNAEVERYIMDICAESISSPTGT